MMLDEFWAPGRMDMLADAAAFVRSYGIRMAYVVQTKAQLVSIYGAEGSENLFQNTGAEVVFGASDMKLCREISERAGFDTVTETSRSRPRFLGWMFPIAREPLRAQRRDELCRNPPMNVVDWFAKVRRVETAWGSNARKAGVLSVRLWRTISLHTNASNFGSTDTTLIARDNPLFPVLVTLREGHRVRISGTFFSDPKDCLRETSLTEGGGMQEPDFLFRFTALSPAP